MATRYEVDIKVTSANDLKNVNWRHGPNKPYAVVWVDPARKVSTRVEEEGDTCPNWDQTLVIPLDRPIEDATVYIDIVHAYADDDTKPLIGSTKFYLREIVDDVGMGEHATRQLKLKRPSGRPHGKLNVQVAVVDTRYRSPDPYYHAPPYAAPTPPAYGGAADGYPYRQAEGYGYGQGQVSGGGYEYGQQQVVVVEEEKKKSKFGGMGMGTGLAVGAVAGALGGIALVEGFDALEDHIADEAADRVEDNLANDDGDGDGDDYDGADDDDGW